MDNTTVSTWDQLDLKDNLLRGIYSYGFEKPSPIQQQSIVPIIKGRDVIAQAQSGTGKTGAFTISMLERIDENEKVIQGLIMAPTRELAAQINKVVDGFSTFMDSFSSKLLIGGTSMDNDIKELEKNPQILIGTPGRVHDLIRRKKIDARTIKMLVLDEADEMLSSGFKEQVYNIFQFLGTNVQVTLFSATLPNEIQQLTDKFMRIQ